MVLEGIEWLFLGGGGEGKREELEIGRGQKIGFLGYQ